MTKPEWGRKHTCSNCGAKFYDLEKVPVICPSCGHKIVVQSVLKSRRSAPAETTAATSTQKGETASPDAEEDDNLLSNDDDLVLEENDDEDKTNSLIENSADIDEDDET